MRRFALEAHLPLDIGKHLDRRNSRHIIVEEILWPRVRHEARRRIVVRPRTDEVQLAAAALLGGGAQETHAAGLARGLKRVDGAEEGGEAGGCDEIVAAGVTYAGEGVVLGVEDDEAAAGAEVSGECSLNAVCAGRGGDAKLGEWGG